MNVKEQLLGKRTLALLGATIVSFALGALSMVYFNDPSLLVFPKGTLGILIALVVFAVGFMFFGYLTPLPMFFVGTQTGELIINSSSIPLEALTLSLSALIVSYSGITLGNSLLKDMAGKGNFLKVVEASLILLIVGVAVAAVGDFLV